MMNSGESGGGLEKRTESGVRHDRRRPRRFRRGGRIRIEMSGLRYWYLRRVVGTAIGALGPAGARRVAEWLARGAWELTGPGRTRAERRIREAIRGGLPLGAEPARISRSCYEHVGRFCAETLFFRRRIGAGNWRQVVHVEDEGSIRASCEARRPAIFVTGYAGNPGVCAFALGQLCRPIYVLAEMLSHPFLRAWQRDLCAASGVRLIPRDRARTELPAVLERGGKVLLIGEHFRGDGRGDVVRFLGRRLRCHQTVRVLSRGFDAPVTVFSCHRNGTGSSFSLRADGTVPPGDADVSGSVMALLEDVVVRDPGQFLWMAGEPGRNAAPVGRAPAALI